MNPTVAIVVSVVTEPAKFPWRERWKTRRLIRTLRRHRDVATRQYAAGNLARTGDPSAPKALAEAAVHDDSPYVRNSALANLAMLDAKSHAGLFGHALNDESLMVVTTAIKGLTAAGDPRRADQVAGYLDHELHDVQHLAATALRAWGWDTDDVRCARVAIPLEEWGRVAGLGAGAVAEVAGLITDDLPWRDRDRERQQAIQALEQLMGRHADGLSDTDLHVVNRLASLQAPAYGGRDDRGFAYRYRDVDLTGLRRLCSAELERRATR